MVLVEADDGEVMGGRLGERRREDGRRGRRRVDGMLSTLSQT